MSEEGQNINSDDQNTEPTVNNDDQNPVQNPEDNPAQEPTDQNPENGGNEQNPENGGENNGEQGGEDNGEGGAEEGGNTEGGETEGEGESTEEEEAPQPVNCWQYSRDVYLLGRSWKYRYLTEDERAAIIEFISAMAETRPGYVDYINIKAGNPPAAEFVEEEANSSASESSDEGNAGEGEEQEDTQEEAKRKLVWTYLEKQNDESLAKMVQKIGRSLKVQFCTQEEKELCDALFEATDERRHQTLNDYVDLREAASSDSSTADDSGEGEGSNTEGGENNGEQSSESEGGNTEGGEGEGGESSNSESEGNEENGSSSETTEP